jgi:protein-disulfide isomerase/uncharacterized membrane protein
MPTITPSKARFGIAISALVGLFASAYLFYTYVTGAPIACGIVSGCEAVRASKWATTVFNLPRPVLGLVFYVGIFALLVLRLVANRDRKILWRLTQLGAAIGFFESAVLFVVQWVDVKAFCVWCLVSGLAATVIAAFAWFDRLEETREVPAALELRWYFVSMLVFMPVAAVAFSVLIRTPHAAEPATPTAIEQPANKPSVSAAEILLNNETPIEGPITAKLLVVEFGDFQCPVCGQFAATMKRLREEYKGKLRFAWRNFPLHELHPLANQAAAAGYCAHKQGKFFPYADGLLADQEHLDQASLVQKAVALGMDKPAFEACLAADATKQAVTAERAQGEAIGVRYTPTIFVGNVKVDQALPYDDLKKLIDAQMAK